MHADCANLIMWYLSIRWFDSKTENTVATVRISGSFLWYAMNELLHTMQEQINACDARTNWCMWCKNNFFFFFVHGWSLQSSSLIKSWVQNPMSTVARFLFDRSKRAFNRLKRAFDRSKVIFDQLKIVNQDFLENSQMTVQRAWRGFKHFKRFYKTF